MKITNLSENKKDVEWKLGDYFLTGNGGLRRIDYMVGKGFYILAITDNPENANNSTKIFKDTVAQLVRDFSSDFDMTKVRIKEVIVEEV